MQIKPDFEYTKPEADTKLLFVHRQAAEWRDLLGRQSGESR